MSDARVLAMLGLRSGADTSEVAGALRGLAGMSAAGTNDPALWARFVEAIVRARGDGRDDARADLAELANRVVEHAVVAPGGPGEERYGSAAWDRELDVGPAASDEVLRALVIEEIAPRLWDAGLFHVIDYA